MEDIWVIFYDDEGKELSFGNVGKVTDWISKWKSWRGNSKSKQPYIDGKVKFSNIVTVYRALYTWPYERQISVFMFQHHISVLLLDIHILGP